jgi:hypothetical protein
MRLAISLADLKGCSYVRLRLDETRLPLIVLTAT